MKWTKNLSHIIFTFTFQWESHWTFCHPWHVSQRLYQTKIETLGQTKVEQFDGSQKVVHCTYFEFKCSKCYTIHWIKDHAPPVLMCLWTWIGQIVAFSMPKSSLLYILWVHEINIPGCFQVKTTRLVVVHQSPTFSFLNCTHAHPCPTIAWHVPTHAHPSYSNCAHVFKNCVMCVTRLHQVLVGSDK